MTFTHFYPVGCGCPEVIRYVATPAAEIERRELVTVNDTEVVEEKFTRTETKGEIVTSGIQNDPNIQSRVKIDISRLTMRPGGRGADSKIDMFLYPRNTDRRMVALDQQSARSNGHIILDIKFYEEAGACKTEISPDHIDLQHEPGDGLGSRVLTGFDTVSRFVTFGKLSPLNWVATNKIDASMPATMENYDRHLRAICGMGPFLEADTQTPKP